MEGRAKETESGIRHWQRSLERRWIFSGTTAKDSRIERYHEERSVNELKAGESGEVVLDDGDYAESAPSRGHRRVL